MLRQTFVHCAIFLTAASRRSLGRISVPVWLVVLSDQLPIVALVSRYLTNKLMGRRLILERPKPLIPSGCPVGMLCGITTGFPELFPTRGQITYVLLTRSPLSIPPKRDFSFDLHVLSTPPAFVLSQDQTLLCRFIFFVIFPVIPAGRTDRTRSTCQRTRWIILKKHHPPKQTLI